jgi:predicted glutamine amidotransferase
MCGLVGAIGNITKEVKESLDVLLILDSLRGTDSTGAAFVSLGEKPDIVVCKMLGHTYNLIESRQYMKAATGSFKAFIGHNRYATQGKVSTRNAHPFEMNTLVGAHNGTLRTKYLLANSAEFQVDSENLFHHIDTLGLDSALEVLDGAWALTWFDTTTNEMCFLRNKERPLYLAWTFNDKTIFWASEKWMLEVALSRSGIKHHTPILLEEDSLLKVFVGSGGELKPSPLETKASKFSYPTTPRYSWPLPQGMCTETVQKPKAKPFKKADYPKDIFLVGTKLVDTTTNGLVYYPLIPEAPSQVETRIYSLPADVVAGDFITCEGWQLVSFSDGTRFNRAFGARLVVQKPKSYKGVRGTVLDHTEWVKKYGVCSFCVVDIDPSENGWAITSEGQSLCKGCYGDPEITKYIQVNVTKE